MIIGDKVVCIKPGYFDFNGNHYKDVSKKLKLNKIYTILKIEYNLITIEEFSNTFTIYRFVELKEYRKIKLQKICSKQEIK